jgi:hypothetical protein
MTTEPTPPAPVNPNRAGMKVAASDDLGTGTSCFDDIRKYIEGRQAERRLLSEPGPISPVPDTLGQL